MSRTGYSFESTKLLVQWVMVNLLVSVLELLVVGS